MTLCVKTGYQCNCQPDEGVWCPDYKPDAYVQCLMDAITELRSTRPEGGCTECEAWNLTCPKCGAAKGGECGWPSNCPTGQNQRSAAQSSSTKGD